MTRAPSSPTSGGASRRLDAGLDEAAGGQCKANLELRRSLRAVLDDPAVEIHLRIEAAKALMPCFEDWRRAERIGPGKPLWLDKYDPSWQRLPPASPETSNRCRALFVRMNNLGVVL